MALIFIKRSLNDYSACHLWVRATAVGELARIVESALELLAREEVGGFRLSQGFEPDAVVLPFFVVDPTHCVSGLDGDYLRFELELQDSDFGQIPRVAASHCTDWECHENETDYQ